MSGKVRLAILAAVLIAFSLSFEAQNMAAPLGWFVPGSSQFRSEPGATSLPGRTDETGVARPGARLAPGTEL